MRQEQGLLTWALTDIAWWILQGLEGTATAGKVTVYLLGVLTVLHSHKTLLQARSKPLTRGRETEEDTGHLAWVTSGSLSFPFHSVACLLSRLCSGLKLNLNNLAPS